MLRAPPLISSPPLRSVSFVAGIDMIWHQMRARSAIAAAFFTIALLRFAKPSFKRRDGFL